MSQDTLPGWHPYATGPRRVWVVAFVIAEGCTHGGAPLGGPSAGACPAGWLDLPPVDGAIAVPSGNARVVLHAAAAGTQNYACKPGAADGGTTYAWSLAGPDATLTDCRSTAIGRHFASDAGPAAPEWQMADGAFVVAHKVAVAPAASGSVPWLLGAIDRHGGGGPMAEATFVQRVRTSGGVAPSSGCDEGHAGAMQKVPYTADYYFFAP